VIFNVRDFGFLNPRFVVKYSFSNRIGVHGYAVDDMVYFAGVEQRVDAIMGQSSLG
jgi:hypothetical protein